MGVMIDEAGCDDAPLRVDRALGGRTGVFANPDDLAVLDCDIRCKCGLARAVDDASVFDEQIKRHAYSSLLPPLDPSAAACRSGPPSQGRMARQHRFARCKMTLRSEGRSGNIFSQNATRVCGERRSPAKMSPAAARRAK